MNCAPSGRTSRKFTMPFMDKPVARAEHRGLHMIRTLAALALGIAASPAFADAVTYSGTIGDLPVVVEILRGPGGGRSRCVRPLLLCRQGRRYSAARGAGPRSKLGFVEEVPCAEALNNGIRMRRTRRRASRRWARPQELRAGARRRDTHRQVHHQWPQPAGRG